MRNFLIFAMAAAVVAVSQYLHFHPQAATSMVGVSAGDRLMIGGGAVVLVLGLLKVLVDLFPGRRRSRGAEE